MSNKSRKKLLSLLSKPNSLGELSSKTGMKKGVVKSLIDSIRDEGYFIQRKDGMYFLNTNPIRQETEIDIPRESVYAVLTDTHLGSEFERLDLIGDYIDFCKREGASFYLHAGDFVQGVGIYSTETAELRKFTVDSQLEHFCKNFPVVNKMFGIMGNHDLKQFEKGHSTHPSQKIESERKDIEIVGDYYGRLVDKKSRIAIDLLHPAKGSAYATSYHPQKHVERIKPGQEPAVLLWGHQHDSMYLPYRGVHILKAGCFQDENAFTLRQGFHTVLGGWLVYMKHNGERVTEFQPRFKGYK